MVTDDDGDHEDDDADRDDHDNDNAGDLEEPSQNKPSQTYPACWLGQF